MNEKLLEFDLQGFGIVLLLGGWLAFGSLYGMGILFYIVPFPLMFVGLLFICLSFKTKEIVKWWEG